MPSPEMDIMQILLSEGTALTAQKVKAYLNRFSEEDAHRPSGPAIPNEGDAKAKRIETLKKLNMLRNRTALSVHDTTLQQKIWGLLIEQTLTIYDTKSKEALEETLDLVDENLNQIESVIDTYRDRRAKLQMARMIAVYFSSALLAGLVWFLIYAQKTGITADTEVQLLGLPVPVILWSAIGSYTAILYRFAVFGDNGITDPLRWLFSRPLMGVVMGSITYLIIRVGLMTFAPGTPTGNLGTIQLMWLVAFLAGFSDRFSDSLLRSLIGRFGGDKDGEIVSMEVTTQNQKAGSFESLLGFLGRRKQEQPAGAGIEGTAGQHPPPHGNGTKQIQQSILTKPTGEDKNTDANNNEGIVEGAVVEKTTTNVKIETEKK
jgi:hypothetical protein